MRLSDGYHRPAMTPQPTVISVNISPGGIPKTPIDVGKVTVDGITGDGHDHEKHITPLQAFNIVDAEDIDDLADAGYNVYPGAMGENLTVRGLEIDDLSIGDVLRFSGGLVVELTKRRTPCFVLDAIDPQLKKDARGKVGFYGKVLEIAPIRAGETITVQRAAVPAAQDAPQEVA